MHELLSTFCEPVILPAWRTQLYSALHCQAAGVKGVQLTSSHGVTIDSGTV